MTFRTKLFILLASICLTPGAAFAADQGASCHSIACAPSWDDLRSLPLSDSGRALRANAIAQGVAAGARALDRQLARAGGGEPTVRDLSNAALSKLVIDGDVDGSRILLKNVWSVQDVDPASAGYGSVPWQIGHPEIRDPNSDEFAAQALGPIFLLAGDRFPSNFVVESTPHLHAFLAALRRREFKDPAYTNIFLMRAVAMLLIGEVVHDDESIAFARNELARWEQYTDRFGIHEFGSPTYYATDLDSLVVGYRLTTGDDRATVGRILARFWRDICDNYFRGRADLSGPHSRDYDFLRGTGGLDLYLYAEGLRDDPRIDTLDLEKVYLVAGLDPGRMARRDDKFYHPGRDILERAAQSTKLIQERPDNDDATERVNYVTPDYAIGSTSGSYGPQDKVINIELASAKDLPVISIVEDSFDNPYGETKKKDRSGHSKPYHLLSNPACRQDKDLLTIDLAPDPHAAGAVESLATNVLLPVGADAIVANGVSVDLSQSGVHPLDMGTTVAVREGHAAVTIRVLSADSVAGQTPTIVLQCDGDGLRSGAARLTVYQYRGPKRRLDENVTHVSLMIRAAHCDDDRAFRHFVAAFGQTALMLTRSMNGFPNPKCNKALAMLASLPLITGIETTAGS